MCVCTKFQSYKASKQAVWKKKRWILGVIDRIKLRICNFREVFIPVPSVWRKHCWQNIFQETNRKKSKVFFPLNISDIRLWYFIYYLFAYVCLLTKAVIWIGHYNLLPVKQSVISDCSEIQIDCVENLHIPEGNHNLLLSLWAQIFNSLLQQLAS